MSELIGKKCKIIKKKLKPYKLLSPSTWNKYKITTEKGTILQVNDVRKTIDSGGFIRTIEYFEATVLTDKGKLLKLDANDIRIIN